MPSCDSPPKVLVQAPEPEAWRRSLTRTSALRVFPLSHGVHRDDHPLLVDLAKLMPDGDAKLLEAGWYHGKLALIVQTSRPSPANVVRHRREQFARRMLVDVDRALADPERAISPTVGSAVLLEGSGLDLPAEREPGSYHPQQLSVGSYQLSRAGALVVDPSSLRLWHTDTGKLSAVVSLPETAGAVHRVSAVRFDATDRWLGIATTQGVYTYDIAKGQVLAGKDAPSDGPRSLSWDDRGIVARWSSQYGSFEEHLERSGAFTAVFHPKTLTGPRPRRPYANSDPPSDPDLAVQLEPKDRPCFQSLVEKGLLSKSGSELTTPPTQTQGGTTR